MFDLTSKCTTLTGLYQFKMSKQIKIIFKNVKTRMMYVSIKFKRIMSILNTFPRTVKRLLRYLLGRKCSFSLNLKKILYVCLV